MKQSLSAEPEFSGNSADSVLSPKADLLLSPQSYRLRHLLGVKCMKGG